MSKVVASELSGGAIRNVLSLLRNEANDTEKLKSAISAFVTSTRSTLRGPAYDAARAKAESYIEVLSTRARLASELASCIQSSISVMSEYMEGYAQLDDSKLSEIETQISDIQSTINQIIYNYRSAKNADGTSKYSGGYYSLISPYESQLEELLELKEKLAGLAAADSSAYGVLTGAASEMAVYTSTVASATTSTVSL